MKFGIFSQPHDRAAEGPPVVDDGFSVAEDVFEDSQIYLNRIIL